MFIRLSLAQCYITKAYADSLLGFHRYSGGSNAKPWLRLPTEPSFGAGESREMG
jgi:hypothetical protein